MCRLFVVGNGFDLDHGVKSAYSNFLEYVCKYHHDKFHRIGSMFGEGNPSFLWKDFENNLATFDVNRSIQLNLKENVSIARAYPQRNLNDYTSLENACDNLVADIKDLFRSWIKEEVIKHTPRPKYILNRNDYYVTFNYTDTLLRIYGILDNHVLSIHNNLVKEPDITPIFGHGVEVNDSCFNLSEQSLTIIKKCGVDRNEIKNIYRGLVNDFKKQTYNPLRDLEFFLNKVRPIEKVIILGHSLGSVDIPYFESINDKLSSTETAVICSYYREEEKDFLLAQLQKAFGNNANIQCLKIHEILEHNNTAL